MAVTAKIFLLFVGVAIVKCHHLHHFNHPQNNHHSNNGIHGFFDNLFHPGIFGVGLFGSDNMFGNGDSAQDQYVDIAYTDENMGQEENHAPFDIGTGYEDYYLDLDTGVNRPDQNNVMIGQPNESNPDVNLNIDVAKEPHIADDHDSNSHEPEASTVTVEIKPDEEPDQGNQADNNQLHLNKATDNVEGPNINIRSGLNTAAGNVVLSGLTQQNNPDETNNDSVKRKVPGFLDEDIKKSTVKVDPDSINHKIPGSLDEDIKEGIVKVDPVPINHKVPEFLDEDTKKDTVMVDPVSINHKVPDFLDEDTKKDTVMVDPDSINHKVSGVFDEDIKKGIVMVDPELKYNINKVNKAKVSVEAGLDVTVGNNAVNSQNNPEDEKVDSIGNVKTVPGLNDDYLKKGVLMVDPELKYNINEADGPIVTDMNIAKESISQNNPSITTENTDDLIGNEKKDPELIGNKVGIDTSTDEPKLSHNIFDDSQFSKILEPDHKETVSGFKDEEIKQGILKIDPEFEINDSDKGQKGYSDAVVFPDEITELNQQNQFNVQQNLPNRFSTGDNNNEYPTVTASVLTPTVQPSNYNIQGQWITLDSIAQTIPTSNNQGSLNQPSNLEFVQNPNEQVPVNNENGYFHVVRNPNGDYTVINSPNNNGSPSQVSVSGNSGINNPGQFYVLAKNPGQTYVNTDSGISGVNKPGQIYVSGNSGINQPGQVYLTGENTDSGNSEVNTPGQIYGSGNSGMNQPGQAYVTGVNTDSSNSEENSPGQIYVSGNSGINQPGQVYVTGGSGARIPGQMYVSNNVPSSGRQAGNGGYYNVIQLNNGQTAYVPVNNDQNYRNGQNPQWNGQSNNGQIYVPLDYNQGQVDNNQNYGNGQNAQWNGQTNNGQMYMPLNYNQGQGYRVLGNNPTGSVSLGSTGNQMNGGSTNNVPLLISYKNKDGEDQESELSDSPKGEKEV